MKNRRVKLSEFRVLETQKEHPAWFNPSCWPGFLVRE